MIDVPWRLARLPFAAVWEKSGCVRFGRGGPTPQISGARMSETVRDSNGAELKDGDSVTLIKDLKVKGTSVVLKRGTLIKNIRLTSDPAEVECRAEKIKDLVLRTEFLKKA
jgi:protein PhnA